MAADPKAIARQFLDAFGAGCSAGNAASVKALYGPDSVACYDGTLFRGADAIAANLIVPRLSSGPAPLRWASNEGQLTATGQLIILATGESKKPEGRFTQLFVLNALPTGGMYVKVDICRFSAGATPSQVTADSTGMAQGFLTQYYTLYASNRAALANVYHAAKSQLSFEGQGFVGAAAIVGKMPTLPNGRHEMATLDAVTCLDAGVAGGVGPAVVALVTGKITLEGEANPLPFGQAFLLAVEGAAPFCANDIFAFNYS